MRDEDAVERVESMMAIIGGKWKPAILYSLVMDGTLRFTELRRRIPRVTQRMLTQQLRDLERHGLVARVHHPEIPPRVEYSVTALGRSLHPIFQSVCEWAGGNYPEIERARARYSSRRNREGLPGRQPGRRGTAIPATPGGRT